LPAAGPPPTTPMPPPRRCRRTAAPESASCRRSTSDSPPPKRSAQRVGDFPAQRLLELKPAGRTYAHVLDASVWKSNPGHTRPIPEGDFHPDIAAFWKPTGEGGHVPAGRERRKPPVRPTSPPIFEARLGAGASDRTRQHDHFVDGLRGPIAEDGERLA